MRFRAFLVLLVAFIAGCGGGGGSSPGGETVTITIPVGQTAQTTVGGIVVTFGANNSGQANDVTLTTATAPRPGNASQVTVNEPMLTIRADTNPGFFTASYPNGGATPAVGIAMQNGKAVGAFRASTGNGQTVIHVESDYLQTSPEVQGSSWVITLGLGLLSHYSPPDQLTGLLPIGNVSNTNKVLIYVPGLLQNAESGRATAESLKQRGSYTAAFVFQCDWRLGFDEAGGALADDLGQFGFKTVDIVAYSRGGLVTRWALEKLDATRSVKRVLFLGTPNTGCAHTLEMLFSAVVSQFFNDPTAVNAILNPEDNCLSELMPGSSKLAQLNTPSYQQQGNVDYLFVGGDKILNGDTIVGLSSARFEGDLAQQLTNGSVERATLNGFSHFTLDEPGPAGLAYLQLPGQQAGIDVTIVSNPNEALPSTGSWQYAITVTNNTNQSVTVDTFQYEGFNRYGTWTGNFWYNPNSPAGQFFPQQPYHWNQWIGPGQSVPTLYIETWADLNRTPVWNAAADRKAGTVNWILLARGANGTHYETQTVLRLTYNGITPQDPHTRSAGGLPSPGAMGAGRWAGP